MLHFGKDKKYGYQWMATHKFFLFSLKGARWQSICDRIVGPTLIGTFSYYIFWAFHLSVYLFCFHNLLFKHLRSFDLFQNLQISWLPEDIFSEGILFCFPLGVNQLEVCLNWCLYSQKEREEKEFKQTKVLLPRKELWKLWFFPELTTNLNLVTEINTCIRAQFSEWSNKAL